MLLDHNFLCSILSNVVVCFFLSVFSWSLYCLSFDELRLLITPFGIFKLILVYHCSHTDQKFRDLVTQLQQLTEENQMFKSDRIQLNRQLHQKVGK
jgi:hypothetical protein